MKANVIINKALDQIFYNSECEDKPIFCGLDPAKPGSDVTVKYKKRQCGISCHTHCEGNHGFEIIEGIKSGNIDLSPGGDNPVFL